MKAIVAFSLTAVFLLLSSSVARGQKLTEKRFDQLLRELQPNEQALWRTVPWRIDLLEAQRDAVNEQKPIFVWAMDGHPLGCT